MAKAAKKKAKAAVKKAAPKKPAAKKPAPVKKQAAKKAPRHVPKNTQPVVTYLYIEGVKEALDFYAKAFGAKEVFRMAMKNGVVVHAEIDLEGCRIMMGEANPQWDARSPKMLGGASSGLMTYVKDCDAVLERAVKAGCSLTRPAQDQFWGDRSGQVKDPFGHVWSFSTHKREVSPAEMAAAMEKMG